MYVSHKFPNVHWFFFFLSRDIFAKTITPVMETETIGLESPFELRRL